MINSIDYVRAITQTILFIILCANYYNFFITYTNA